MGDYTRILCAALNRQGFIVTILAINDAFVSAPSHEEQNCGNDKIKVFRLPHQFSWSLRETLAIKWIKEQQPDWVSLQFVLFTFHPKGICLGLGGLLAEIKKTAWLHVMVHEPWIVWSFRFPFKLRFLGVIQKFAVMAVFKVNSPDAISTSLPLYQRALRGINKHVELLPLFGNIPKANIAGNREWLLLKCLADPSSGFVLAGFFGNISRFLSLTILRAFIKEHIGKNHKVIIFHAGGMGAAGQKVWDEMTLVPPEGVSFVSLGRLSEVDASRYFQSLDYGLTSYSTVTWGKSGVVAAMRDHGLTVFPCGDDTMISDKIRSEVVWPSPWNVDIAATALMRQLSANMR